MVASKPYDSGRAGTTGSPYPCPIVIASVCLDAVGSAALAGLVAIRLTPKRD